MIKIKVCGITELEHALAASEHGADFIGLVFAPSRREISLEKANQIAATIRCLTTRPQIVGVFVNEDIDRLNQIAESLHLDWVQLSGTESLDYCKQVSCPIIKTIHVSSNSTADSIIEAIETGYNSLPQNKPVYLLDTKGKDCYGGTGKTFDWTIAEQVSLHFPIMVAGGLTVDNVATLIKKVKPFGVDVSSGVETEGGKDVAKIARFIQVVREAETMSQIRNVPFPTRGGNCNSV